MDADFSAKERDVVKAPTGGNFLHQDFFHIT